MRLSVAEPENKFLNTFLLLLSYERYHNSNSFGNLGMAIITLRVSAGIQGTRAAFQRLRYFKNLFCSRFHYGNKTFEMTAVEWYSNKLVEILGDMCNEFTQEQTLANHYALKQANELFEQQIKDAWKSGDTNGRIGILKTKEQYYNETFGDVE
jgi:hypothetical protein